MSATYGVKFDEYGAAVGSVKFEATRFFRVHQNDSADPIRYYTDATGVRWFVRRDVEQSLGVEGYPLTGMCNAGNRWTPRVHAAVGDLNAVRVVGLRCLLRSDDVVALLQRYGSVPAVRLARKIVSSTSAKERNPKAPTNCEHCGHVLAVEEMAHESA